MSKHGAKWRWRAWNHGGATTYVVLDAVEVLLCVPLLDCHGLEEGGHTLVGLVPLLDEILALCVVARSLSRSFSEFTRVSWGIRGKAVL